jgi:alpha-glutamyl/putrescinyl thymine pyrophosphorylase clade 1
VEKFFAFARERHLIYLRRAAGLTRSEWTSDHILSKYRFTNVFRELDATTVWFKNNVREPMRDRPEVLLATVLFRWFNRITTGEAIFQQEDLIGGACTAWDSLLNHGHTGLTDVEAAVRTYCGKGPYVTGGYIIKTPDGYDKLKGVLKCVEWFMEAEGRETVAWLDHAEWMLKFPEKRTLEECWQWLRQFPYMGDFMAYEVVTDLRHTALLDRAPDIMTWANPGPGAARGLGRILHNDPHKFDQKRDKALLIEEMRKLLAVSDEKFGPALQHKTAWTDQYIPEWEMRDVEHTLCEFDKYERARLGEGRPRGVYR